MYKCKFCGSDDIIISCWLEGNFNMEVPKKEIKKNEKFKIEINVNEKSEYINCKCNNCKKSGLVGEIQKIEKYFKWGDE